MSPRAVLAFLFLSLVAPSMVKAHDIPSRITVYAFVKPEGQQLNVLLRVPMEALGEIVFPTRGPGYLVISEADSEIRDAAQVYLTNSITFYENGQELSGQRLEKVRVSLPSNRSFTSYSEALNNIESAPLSDDVNLFWRQGMLDVLVTYPIQSGESEFSVNPELGTLADQTTTVLRFLLPNGGERVFNYVGNPGVVLLDPSWFQAVFRFVEMGFFHILEGLDHLLFLFCLVIPIREIKKLIPIVTSFTLAHSITLIGSAFGVSGGSLWFPSLIETLIAISIVYMAFENIIGTKMEKRWIVTFGFGLVHGFGFSFMFSDTLQFAGGHLFSSLLAFNVGVELGQLMILLLVIPALNILFRHVVSERTGVILLSALVAHSAWHWMLERTSLLSQYQFTMPVVDAAFYAGLMRWGMLIIVIFGVGWAMYEVFRRFNLATPLLPKRDVDEPATRAKLF